ncbi:hypothetical protein TVAG_474380 [Trichomonas vaginalis G3]|uniref:Uncharacterized protein n=1 Tax=Trichomonas vaginalis (strain ATCC PRA-98 / G3) TaxID=412133 RepID=A2ESX4_TRIV3|nr:hypothetical protein TVAGG3_0191790 [Trichomonas vaginalis G3]EAY04232.1 hypothetical protein TVAG_474380 [Trichomonas vaginalis G3]KAI5550027.1 hypothetical protein TVAGG3_0191790 [Trichomonas vaginalis G3]|eukprot:XP_001316455.1 hypothetical protein [Trichomonas vaginalis G3]
MNECNITQNRVKDDIGGYLVQSITSDSYITIVNLVENNQSSGNFNHHSMNQTYPSKFKITMCNYLRNKGTSGQLIYSNSDLFMSYCCIFNNEIDYIFRAISSTITFENSVTDSVRSINMPPTFKNTYYYKCPLLNKSPFNYPNKEEGEYFPNPFVKGINNFPYLFVLLASICS